MTEGAFVAYGICSKTTLNSTETILCLRPDVLVEDIIENLESSLESLKELANNLEKEE